jgi:hypothetical protein
MKQSEAAEFWPLIKAWGEGKKLQFKFSPMDYWRDFVGDSWFIADAPSSCYRIKPEPREWWQIDHPDFLGCRFYSYSSAIEWCGKESLLASRIIKVREVLDEN